MALPNDKDDSTSNSNVNPTRNQTVPATLPISNVNPKLTLYEEVNRNIVDFCPRLSCATWFCEAHGKLLIFMVESLSHAHMNDDRIRQSASDNTPKSNREKSEDAERKAKTV